MTASVVLPARLDLSSVRDVAGQISDLRGADATLDASRVEHLGALGLQLLAASARTWAADGKRLIIAPRSEAFKGALALFGEGAELAGTEA